QETKFPEQGATAIAVTADKPVQMAMRLRIPSWLQSAPTVKVNGKPLDATAAPGSYLTLARTWKTGDRVEMEMPMHLYTERMPDDAKTQAILYGPLVLAGDLGSEGLTSQMVEGREGPGVGRLRMEIPSFKAAGDVSSWVKAEGPLAFRTSGQ